MTGWLPLQWHRTHIFDHAYFTSKLTVISGPKPVKIEREMCVQCVCGITHAIHFNITFD